MSSPTPPAPAVAGASLDHHLPECPTAAGEPRACDWCAWAVDIPEVRLLTDALTDVRALLVGPGVGAVAWVVATGDLLRAIDGASSDQVLVPSVRELVDGLRRRAVAAAEPLRHRLDATVAPGSELHHRCERTAGAVAAAAIQAPAFAGLLDRLPSRVRTPLAALSAQLSEHTQVATVLPVVETVHWQGLPVLATQPEWARRPAPGTGRGGRRPPGGGGLEAFVVESLVDHALEQLFAVAGELASAAPTVQFTHDRSTGRMSPSTRAMTWRHARFDWHLTLLHTGRADFWGTTVDDGVTTAEVPWFVACALNAGADAGLVSATHAPDDGGSIA